MHGAISSILSFFLSPFNWIIILLIAAYVIRKGFIKKTCCIAALLIFLVFSNTFLLNWYAKKWQPQPIVLNKEMVYSCGIVPGGFASPDEKGNGYFNATADRFIEAEKLFKLGNITHILISGGNGKQDNKNFQEGNWVKKQLIIMGIPDSVIFIEDRSSNTADNAMYAKQILDAAQLPPPYLLITSAQHIPRATLLFKQSGVQTIAYPCSYINGRGSFSLSSLVPKISNLFEWETYLKETAGYLFYKMKN